MPKYSPIIISILLLTACQKKSAEEIKLDVQKELIKIEGAFAVAFKDLQTGEFILINQDSVFHAASTMKTPVMIEAFKQAKEGDCRLARPNPWDLVGLAKW